MTHFFFVASTTATATAAMTPTTPSRMMRCHGSIATTFVPLRRGPS